MRRVSRLALLLIAVMATGCLYPKLRMGDGGSDASGGAVAADGALAGTDGRGADVVDIVADGGQIGDGATNGPRDVAMWAPDSGVDLSDARASTGTGGTGGNEAGAQDVPIGPPDVLLGGAGGGTAGGGGSGGTGGRGDAEVPDAPGAQPDALVGGAGGGPGAVGGVGGTGGSGLGGTSGTTDAGVSDVSATQPDAPAGGAAGGAGGTTSVGGTTSAGGTTGAGGTASVGGTISVGGTTSAGGSGGGSGGSAGGSSPCPVAPEVISVFESGQGDMIQRGARTGYWYVFFPSSDTRATPASPMTQTPPLANGSPIAVEASPGGGTCNQYALHTTGSGFGSAPNNYAGIGAYFLPHVPYDAASNPYDVSPYTGIKFKIKSGSGTPPAVLFEVLTKQSLPPAAGGTATSFRIDLYNTRGQMLNDPWTPGGITSTYQTITVPFGTLIPRWVPDSTGCAGATNCQARPFVPTDVLGIQISMYQDPGFPKPVGSTAGTYDLWIDDVAFTTDDSGLQTRAGFPLADPGSMGSCLKPQGPSADAKFLVPAYEMWKRTFVSGDHVVRPVNGNDTVSEGIAYGMMIAVNMNDKDLFDKLYGYWKSHATAGSLMTWCVPAGSGSCPASGGSATGADEDAAYALLMADKAGWGGTYQAAALTMINDIWTSDIDGGGTKLPKGGSNYGSPTGAITSASYFAPAYYRAFAAVDSAHDWNGVATATYGVINGTIAGSNGLIPAWCSNSCTQAASNGAPTDIDYQYDSHRIPMRIGMDYCFNGTTAAKTYTTKTTAFFASAATNGIGYILDMYTPSGGPVSGTTPNSASIIGTAAVGAMASGNQAFLNDAYQTVFDLLTRGTLAPVDASGKSPYSYHNATVGMLTLLIMTGNFMH